MPISINKEFPICTFLISLATLCTSIFLATSLHDFPTATVTIGELKAYGAVDLQSLSKWEVWRLPISQLVHVKQFHMLFNVASLFLLGFCIEHIIGRLNVFLLWLVGGSFGVAVSVYFSNPPFDVGSGASQAVFAFAAASLVVIHVECSVQRWLKYALIVIVACSLFLDFMSVHYPKPGHISGFIAGFLLSLYFVSKNKNHKI